MMKIRISKYFVNLNVSALKYLQLYIHSVILGDILVYRVLFCVEQN